MLLSLTVQPGAYKAADEVTHVTSGSFHIHLFHMLLSAMGHVYFSVHICIQHSDLEEQNLISDYSHFKFLFSMSNSLSKTIQLILCLSH